MARLKERYQKEVAPAIAKEFRMRTRWPCRGLDKIVLNMGMAKRSLMPKFWTRRLKS